MKENELFPKLKRSAKPLLTFLVTKEIGKQNIFYSQWQFSSRSFWLSKNGRLHYLELSPSFDCGSCTYPGVGILMG